MNNPPSASPTEHLHLPSARVVRWEIALVLLLSLGKSGINAAVNLAEMLFTEPLGDQTVTLNQPMAHTVVFDLIRQLLSIGFSLVPVLLVLHLIWIYGRNPLRTFGLDFRRPGRDVAWGLGLFAAMGLGTLLVYAVGRALGVTAQLVGSGMGDHWWTPIVLTLSAIRHGLLEEIIMVAWLIDRMSYLQQIRHHDAAHTHWSTTPTGAFKPVGARGVVVIIAFSALVRASYHLYQGVGPGVGNLLMGIIFVLFYLKYQRVMPLVIAHALLDISGFLGYPLLVQLGWFGG